MTPPPCHLLADGHRVLVLDANEFRMLEDLADEGGWQLAVSGPARTLARKLDDLR